MLLLLLNYNYIDMEKQLWRFYYKYSNGLKFEIGVGKYKYPKRSKYYKKLKEMFNATFIDSYGYERIYNTNE